MSELFVDANQQWQIDPEKAWPVHFIERESQRIRLEGYWSGPLWKPKYLIVTEMDPPLMQALNQFDPLLRGIRQRHEPYVADPLSPQYEIERRKAADYQAHLETLRPGMGRSLNTVIGRLATMHCKHNLGLVMAADKELRESPVNYYLAYRQATEPNVQNLLLSEIVGIVPSDTSPVGPEPLVRGRDGIPGCLPPFIYSEVYVDMASIPEPAVK